MKKVGILGAGISGLSMAKLLIRDVRYDVEVLEKDTCAGGIAKTRTVNGATYHPIGGHCFNSKHQEVLDFVFGLLPVENWHKVQRNSNILFEGMDINYPIEYSIKEIHKHDPDLATTMALDFLEAVDTGQYANLADWFMQKFGKSLSERYLIPYNKKIWNQDPGSMSHVWVSDKLPIPDKKAFIESLIKDKKDQMPHSVFYYPISNNQNSLIEALASDLSIITDYEVSSIGFNKNESKWHVNSGDKCYDILVSTLPLNIVPKLISNTPAEVLDHAARLKYNKVTTMFWSTKGTDRTWSYFPDPDNLFHRQIHIGNFFNPRRDFTITESVGEKSFDEMAEAGRNDPHLNEPLDYNVSEHAYVVFDNNTRESRSSVMNYLDSIGLHTLGRFGEWEYYNMDICIRQAMQLQKKLES
jgi:protoporphyrinogen oxidase